MENAPQEKENLFAKQTFDPDFQPLYALTEPQYQAIINQLSNLVIAVIEQYKNSEQGELTQQVATHAHGILRDYDDDVAVTILTTAQEPQHHLPRDSNHRGD
jgi:hypothetical protein